MTVCEEGCVFNRYNESLKKAVCSCLTNYIITILFILSIIAIFRFIYHVRIKIENFCNNIINKEKKDKKGGKNKINILNKKSKIKKMKTLNKDKNKNELTIKKDKKIKINKNKSNKIQRNKIKISPIINPKTKIIKIKKNNFVNNMSNLINNNEDKSKNLLKSKKINKKPLKLKKAKINNNLESYNDMEMNILNYEEALIYDKRSYSQYYLSLVKTKHILIFTFFQRGDYNSQIIKIYIFFLTYVINYVVSAMFYSDSTMHKIYVDEGSFDFTYQLPQMCYSFLISISLKAPLNILGLYENNIIEIRKKIKTKKDIEKDKTKIKIKIFLFFIITYIFIFFFWLYLGCFCAVYKNTQIHLFFSVSSSFGLSFISPFFIYLLPGLFRIPSLNSKNERSCLFKFSKLLQIF